MDFIYYRGTLQTCKVPYVSKDFEMAYMYVTMAKRGNARIHGQSLQQVT